MENVESDVEGNQVLSDIEGLDDSASDTSFRSIPTAPNVPSPDFGERTSSSDSNSPQSGWYRRRTPFHKKRHLSPVEPPSASSTSSCENDSQSTKCPICLQIFREQEVGSPDACDHSFCFKCILEWSKTATTCPIDRQSFRMIVVRNQLGGNVVRQVNVEEQQARDDLLAFVDVDAFCQICGSRDNEERMLLCDGCNMGYHLECLTPPLESVPSGSWMCPLCSFDHTPRYTNAGNEQVNRRRSFRFHRTGVYVTGRRITRSSASQRETTREPIHLLEFFDDHNIEVTLNQPSTSRQTSSTVSTPKTRRKKRKRTIRKSRVRITYKVGKSSSQKVVIRSKAKAKSTKRKGTRRTKHKKVAKAASTQTSSTTKRRLAKHFGICAPSREGQLLPDMRIITNNDNLSYLRTQAGIPTFRLFGNRDELDYFSTSDVDDDDDGSTTLCRRRPTAADATVFRRAAARKARLLPKATPAALNCNVLDGILASQERMCAKDAVLSLHQDGTLHVERNRVDVNGRRGREKRVVPMFGPVGDTSGRADAQPNYGSQDVQQYRGANSAAPIYNDVSTSICDVNGGPKEDHRSAIDAGIYSDIETVSTSKVAVGETDDDDDDEDADDGEDKTDVDQRCKEEEDVSSTTNLLLHPDDADSRHSDDDDDEEEEECPNFSIYSKDTLNLVANRNVEQDEIGSSRDINNRTPVRDELDDDDIPSPPRDLSPTVQTIHNRINFCHFRAKPMSAPDLYSDSDEDVVRASSDATKPFGIGDIRSLTEDISEEERSYTPCLDERTLPAIMPLAGLDTEAISDDERNDFDETHTTPAPEAMRSCARNKPISDLADALEINAKESELDFSTTCMRPEDYEEGEIVDKLKKLERGIQMKQTGAAAEMVATPTAVAAATLGSIAPAVPVEPLTPFKRISKSTKERNYRDKDNREHSKSRSRERNKENERERRRDRKKEKRKELERYNVRSLLADKRRQPKDKFGRDAQRKRSMSRSTRSPSFSPLPYRSPSPPRDRPKRRPKSRRSSSRSRSRSRPPSVPRKRSRNRGRKMRSVERNAGKSKKNRSSSHHHSRTLSPPRRHRDWATVQAQRARAAWTPSLSQSRSPECDRHVSPSWTPPRHVDNSSVKPHNLTVILSNDSSSKKKKDKKDERKKKEKRNERKKKDASGETKSKKKRRDRTPLPSKEVFASGDNILVSVSFNKDGDEVSKRAKSTRGDDEAAVSGKRSRREKEKRREVVVTPPPTQQVQAKTRKKKQQDLSAVKPVAIIDLDRSPFKEITPSPKDVIVLSDSDHSPDKTTTCDTNLQADYDSLLGPKTPPEPQVKFSLNSKLQQIRQINNPLHDPEDEAGEPEEIDPQDELEQRLNEAMHKGPNTPPSDPPNSPPSSPDAYDPFDPTKSRSTSPIENEQAPSASVTQKTSDNDGETMVHEEDHNLVQLTKPPQGSETPKSHTPPLADIQPADSQSNPNTPDDSNTSSEKSSTPMMTMSMNPLDSSPIFLQTKPISASTSMAPTSTPTTSTTSMPRISVLSATLMPPLSTAALAVPTQKPHVPIKPSPTKAAMKMMPTKRPTLLQKANKAITKSDDSNNMDLDSPYSPGPSDFDDLFEPPTEHKKVAAPSTASSTMTKSTPVKSTKVQSSFDALFGTSPPSMSKRKLVAEKNAVPSKRAAAAIAAGSNLHSKCKQVKVDEDSLRILDELPNSAVEMQVKDKFLKKLNRQERVVEEVKLVLKPHYNKKHINKDEYKDILRRAVPKICHNKSGEINPQKIQNLIEAYVKKFRHSKKVSSSSSSLNLQK